MENRWSDKGAQESLDRWAELHGEDLALRTYTSRLLGSDAGLVLHGGGNTSLKGTVRTVLGEDVPALFIKASGHDLATIDPAGHVPVDLAYIERLRGLEDLSDEEMENQLRLHLFDHKAPTPSIETPVHAFLPGRFVDHTHADAILALTNQPEGDEHVRAALGADIPILPYLPPGFQLSLEVDRAGRAAPEARAMVWTHHGIIVWGETARESYERMIDLVSRAEDYLRSKATRVLRAVRAVEEAEVARRLAKIAPLVRGRLARTVADPDRPWRRVVLRPLTTPEVRDVIDAPEGRALAVSPPLTGDHLIRTRALPAWIDATDFDDTDALARAVDTGIEAWAADYRAYLERHASRRVAGVESFPAIPAVVLVPGLGALCAGEDAASARIARDITEQTLLAKASIAAMGGAYRAPAEEHLYDVEYRPLQHAKLAERRDPPLAGQVVLVTGAAGAIGSGISECLLDAGAHVAITDLPGDGLDRLANLLGERHPDRVLPVPLDVSDPASVEEGFALVSRSWGGLDGVIINAGLAHVSPLESLDLEQFRRLERVNTDGTLLLLSAASRHLRIQGTGGDVVLVSTKNVFAPGAKFGAYSATKAAAHQLARIASQEFAPDDIRVNMVAPDAVFSHGERPSGLWAEVGPDRMKARGLDAAGLEAYYRDRNLLKAAITAQHVGRAVLYFLERRTPTTGATLPVDGGLPDATPR
jgi:rhamnose utilization protein RhaD (predicted bifunctional aldolase and dehydrogenase)/NAD(P)-dependent dehydrogenase (short-subunit alcohol dehydrogenase family)